MKKFISRRSALLFSTALVPATIVSGTPASGSGSVTISGLGQLALTAFNAASAAIGAVKATDSSINIPSNLLTYLTDAQQAAQALTTVTSTNTQSVGGQFLSAVMALLPIAQPFLATLGPAGIAISVGIEALTALTPEIAMLTGQAEAATTLPGAKPKMTVAQAVALFGPK